MSQDANWTTRWVEFGQHETSVVGADEASTEVLPGVSGNSLVRRKVT